MRLVCNILYHLPTTMSFFTYSPNSHNKPSVVAISVTCSRNDIIVLVRIKMCIIVASLLLA